MEAGVRNTPGRQLLRQEEDLPWPVPGEPSSASGATRRRLAAASVATALVASAALFTVRRWGSLRPLASPSAPNVGASNLSLAVQSGDFEKRAGVGCSNWRSIKILEGGSWDHKAADSAAACGRHCRDTAGCVGFGWKPKACGQPSEVPHECMLFEGPCHAQHDVCWDFYGLPGGVHVCGGESGIPCSAAALPEVPGIGTPFSGVSTINQGDRSSYVWRFRQGMVGCTNWRDIKLGEPFPETSVNACGSRCRGTPYCTGFGWQKDDKCGDPHERLYAGACQLWSGPCTDEPNACFDDYVLEPPSTSTTATSTSITQTTTSPHTLTATSVTSVTATSVTATSVTTTSVTTKRQLGGAVHLDGVDWATMTPEQQQKLIDEVKAAAAAKGQDPSTIHVSVVQ